MTGMEAVNLDRTYGSPLIEWPQIARRLERGLTQAPGTGGPNRHTCWLATINRDGSPHVTGVGGLWVDGAFWFETGETTRKGRNVARDAQRPICGPPAVARLPHDAPGGDGARNHRAVRRDAVALLGELTDLWRDANAPYDRARTRAFLAAALAGPS
jgi:hypothetical protein